MDLWLFGIDDLPDRHFRIWTQRDFWDLRVSRWDPSDIWSEWCLENYWRKKLKTRCEKSWKKKEKKMIEKKLTKLKKKNWEKSWKEVESSWKQLEKKSKSVEIFFAKKSKMRISRPTRLEVRYGRLSGGLRKLRKNIFFSCPGSSIPDLSDWVSDWVSDWPPL